MLVNLAAPLSHEKIPSARCALLKSIVNYDFLTIFSAPLESTLEFLSLVFSENI